MCGKGRRSRERKWGEEREIGYKRTGREEGKWKMIKVKHAP